MIIKTINYGGKNIDMNMFESSEIVSNTISNSSMFYEIDFLKHIQYTYSVQTGIIDIGANIGNHSLFFSEFFLAVKQNKTKRSFVFVLLPV
jgi:hypothetical protein